MLLSVQELEVRKLVFEQTYNPGEIDFSFSNVTQSGPLTTSGVAELLEHTGGEIRVQGEVNTGIDAECDRCLGPAHYDVHAPFDLFYKPGASVDADEEEAIDEGEAEIGFYELPGIELEDILREQVLLQLPMQHLCKLDCKGICPVCGCNRNETACNCETHPGDDRWKALQSIATAD